MVFCRGCGKELHETAVTCPHCGAPQKSSSQDKDIPDGIKGWSWGAFLLNWIWAIGNRTWIGLLALVPYVGFIMAIVLGIKGREWAWKNKEWESVEHFNRVQRKWSAWGVGIMLGVVVIGIGAAIAIPAYVSYTAKAQQAQMEQEQALIAEQEAAAAAEAARQAELDAARQEAQVLATKERIATRIHEVSQQLSVAQLWSPATGTQVFDTCAAKAKEDANEKGVDFCKCFVETASQHIPESRLASANSDPEVQQAMQQVTASCNG